MDVGKFAACFKVRRRNGLATSLRLASRPAVARATAAARVE